MFLVSALLVLSLTKRRCHAHAEMATAALPVRQDSGRTARDPAGHASDAAAACAGHANAAAGSSHTDAAIASDSDAAAAADAGSKVQLHGHELRHRPAWKVRAYPLSLSFDSLHTALPHGEPSIRVSNRVLASAAVTGCSDGRYSTANCDNKCGGKPPPPVSPVTHSPPVPWARRKPATLIGVGRCSRRHPSLRRHPHRPRQSRPSARRRRRQVRGDVRWAREHRKSAAKSCGPSRAGPTKYWCNFLNKCKAGTTGASGPYPNGTCADKCDHPPPPPPPPPVPPPPASLTVCS